MAQRPTGAIDEWEDVGDEWETIRATASETGRLSLGRTVLRPQESTAKMLYRKSTELLPMVGMGLGGAAASTLGPPAIPFGAAIGGAGGEALRQLLPGTERPELAPERTKAITTAGIGGFASELIPPGLSKLGPPLKRATSRLYGSALSPSGEVERAAVKEIAPELASRGPMALTREGLERKLTARAATAGSELGKVEQIITNQAVPPKIKADTVRSMLDSYKHGMVVKGTGGVTVNEAGMAAVDSQINKLGEITAQQGNNVSTETWISLRRLLDEQVTNATKGAYTLDKAMSAIKDAQRSFANSIRNQLSAEYPNLAKVNAEYHTWKTAMDVMARSNVMAFGKTMGPYAALRIMGAAGAGVYGSREGGGVAGGVEAAAGFLLLEKAITSPAWRTIPAKGINAIAEAVASGKVQQLTKVLTQYGLVSLPSRARAELKPQEE